MLQVSADGEEPTEKLRICIPSMDALIFNKLHLNDSCITFPNDPACLESLATKLCSIQRRKKSKVKSID